MNKTHLCSTKMIINKNDNIHENEVQDIKKFDFCGPVSHLAGVKYNIRFGIPIEFPSQRKKNIQIGP